MSLTKYHLQLSLVNLISYKNNPSSIIF
jgi:hypothetical protein